jgi:hypothetical protein
MVPYLQHDYQYRERGIMISSPPSRRLLFFYLAGPALDSTIDWPSLRRDCTAFFARSDHSFVPGHPPTA